MASAFVSALSLFPVKSCRGIDVSQAVIEARGFQKDRRWMIADSNGVFLSQREYPRLALIDVAIGNDHFEMNAPGMSALRIPVEMHDGESLHVDIWGDTVGALSGGKDPQRWISSFLGVDCQLVYMPDASIRPVNPEYAVRKDQVSFVDAFPFLLISEGSLANLNSRLKTPLPMNRFRPSIVVKGTEPYAEDGWKTIRIGSTKFHIVKPCSRCATTTVDQATGIRGDEPLRTLALYRKVGNDVNFGQNLIHESLGTLRVGDEVTVLS